MKECVVLGCGLVVVIFVALDLYIISSAAYSWIEESERQKKDPLWMDRTREVITRLLHVVRMRFKEICEIQKMERSLWNKSPEE